MRTLKDIADLAGVSITTVSHVLNETRFVSEDRKKAVMDAVEQLNYRPNRIAQSLRKHQTKTIGFVAPLLASESTNSFCIKSLRGACTALNDDSYSVILGDNSKCTSSEKECEILNEFCSKMVDGLIVIPTEHPMDFQALQKLMGKDFPIVFIDIDTEGYYDSVLVESEEGIYRLVKLMIAEGHRRIGILAGNGKAHMLRFDGYRKALEENGIPFNPELAAVEAATEEAGYRQMGNLLQKNPDMTAVVMVSNAMAIGAVAYLNEHQIRIPQQLAVVVLDDYTWSRVTNPPLSVIDQPAYNIGKRAAAMLIERLENPEKPVTYCQEPLTIIRRKSF